MAKKNSFDSKILDPHPALKMLAGKEVTLMEGYIYPPDNKEATRIGQTLNTNVIVEIPNKSILHAERSSDGLVKLFVDSESIPSNVSVELTEVIRIPFISAFGLLGTTSVGNFTI